MLVTLHIDAAAEAAYAQIVSGLRSARLAGGRSQNALAANLPVRGRAVSEWETGAIRPTMEHMIQLSRELDQRLVILDRNGELLHMPQPWTVGDTWESSERRRLAVPLRRRRRALGLSQSELGQVVGVSRDSIQRWELVHVPPRPIAHVVWAQKLGCSLALWPADKFRTHLEAMPALPRRRQRRGTSAQRQLPSRG